MCSVKVSLRKPTFGERVVIGSLQYATKRFRKRLLAAEMIAHID